MAKSHDQKAMQTAAILAGLRLLQRELEKPGELSPDILEIYYVDGVGGLDADDVDALCYAINTGGMATLGL